MGSNIISRRMHRAISWATAFLLIPTGTFALVLLLNTAGPIPVAFVPFDKPIPELEYKNWKEDFFNRSEGWSGGTGCAIAVTAYEINSPRHSPSDRYVFTVHERLSMRRVGVFEGTHKNFSNKVSYALTPDCKYLLSVEKGALHARLMQGPIRAADEVWCDGLLSDNDLPLTTFEFSSDGRIALIGDRSEAVLFDVSQRKCVRKLSLSADSRSCFLDAKNNPKYIQIGLDLSEAWNLLSQNIGVVCIPVRGGTHTESKVLADEGSFLVRHYDDFIFMYSLDDGRLIHTYKSTQPYFEFGPQCRYAMAASDDPEPLVRLAASINKTFAQWISHCFPASNHPFLTDLETGRTWHGFRGNGNSKFTADGKEVQTFIETGYYVYAVPPAMQAFTPWAWVVLAGWLVLVSFWWWLRKQQRLKVSVEISSLQ